MLLCPEDMWWYLLSFHPIPYFLAKYCYCHEDEEDDNGDDKDECVNMPWNICRGEDNLVDSILSSQFTVGVGGQAQVSRHTWKCFYLLAHPIHSSNQFSCLAATRIVACDSTHSPSSSLENFQSPQRRICEDGLGQEKQQQQGWFREHGVHSIFFSAPHHVKYGSKCSPQLVGS